MQWVFSEGESGLLMKPKVRSFMDSPLIRDTIISSGVPKQCNSCVPGIQGCLENSPHKHRSKYPLNMSLGSHQHPPLKGQLVTRLDPEAGPKVILLLS